MAKITAGPAPWSELRGLKGELVKAARKGAFSRAQNKLGGYNGTVSAPSKTFKNSLTGDNYKVSRDYKMPFKDLNALKNFLKTSEKNVKNWVSTGEVQNVLSDSYKSALSKKGGVDFGNVSTPGDYIDFGFSEAQQKNITSVECKGGHIASIAYNPAYKLMKVLFANRGDEVVFFDLPANLAATLMHLGATGTMAPPDKNGRERHAVGVEFWNLVRIRGTLHGTRYQFAYTVDNRTGFFDYSGTTGGTPIESGNGGNLSRSEADTIANVTQENKPYTPVTEIPKPAKFPSYALEAYGKSDFDRILGEDGKYRPWYDEMKRNWMASGQSYMIKLSDKAEKEYERGNLSAAIEAFKDLSRAGVGFPEAVENQEGFSFRESSGFGAK